MTVDLQEVNIDHISTSGVFKTPYTILIILVQVFVGNLALIIVNSWYINSLYYLLTGKTIFPILIPVNWIYWLLLPLAIYGNLFLFTFIVVLFSSLIFKMLNLISPPQEGIFKKGSKDWIYMHRRFWTAYLPIWLTRSLPLPWMDIVTYKLFGTFIGKNVVSYEGYIDPLFVKIGDFTMTSFNVCIFSHLIYHDKVIIKKVEIGKACIVGPHTLVSPGTTMNEEAILGANSYTMIGQELKGNLIHVGTPALKQLPIPSVEESRTKMMSINKNEKKTNEVNQ